MRWLADFQEQFQLQLENAIVEPGELGDACRYALLSRGKRLRPALAVLTAAALGSDIDATHPALAVEVFHTASLIADDLPCMDDAESRRGRPALHHAFSESTALLASYSLIAFGYQLLSNAPSPVLPQVIETTSRTLGMKGLMGGQLLDLQGYTTVEMIDGKTGSFFELPIVLGWLYGGGHQSEIPTLRRLSHSIGRLFQLADDRDDEELRLPANEVTSLVAEEIILIENNIGELGLRDSQLETLISHVTEATCLQ